MRSSIGGDIRELGKSFGDFRVEWAVWCQSSSVCSFGSTMFKKPMRERAILLGIVRKRISMDGLVPRKKSDDAILRGMNPRRIN
jgi:hypothetical protein